MRKQSLAALLLTVSGIHCVSSLESHDEALFARAIELDIEGIVAKRLDAPYKAGPQLACLKIKNRRYSRQVALGFSG